MNESDNGYTSKLTLIIHDAGRNTLLIIQTTIRTMHNIAHTGIGYMLSAIPYSNTENYLRKLQSGNCTSWC